MNPRWDGDGGFSPRPRAATVGAAAVPTGWRARSTPGRRGARSRAGWPLMPRAGRAPLTRTRRVVAAAVAALVATACSAADDRAAVPPETSTSSTSTTSATTGTTLPPPAVPSAEFQAAVSSIDQATADRMTASWRAGCPVPLEELRLVAVSYWGLDGQARQGELVVAATYAEDIVSVFRRLFDVRFPIESMRLIDEFGGDDDQSMAANNTSAFNCRPATGSNRWSEHAYGSAVDINPVQNPYITRTGAVLPPAGAAHTARDPATPGLITADSPVVAAFRDIGWTWGGTWSSAKDYQHFSATGR